MTGCKSTIRIIVLCILSFYRPGLFSQSIDHWEAVVLAGDIWSYFPGGYEPPADWNAPGFDDSSWAKGPGGIGYGDGDDATEIMPAVSVYLRRQFTIVDLNSIEALFLNVDFDDAFVAYLNGHEIARANIGTPGIPPPFNEFAVQSTFEARLPSGGRPAGFLIKKEAISSCLTEGDNILALQVHNCDAVSTDLSSTTFLTAGIKNESRNYREPPSWFVDPFSESTHLPLVVIETGGQVIPDEPKIEARLKVIDNGEEKFNNQFQEGTDYDGIIGIEIRGESSQMFPKKSYSLELRTSNGSDTIASLLGMPAEEDWILYAPYSDKTMLRNALTFHLGATMGEWQPRNRFCEVYIDGSYAGVYQLMESIKRDSVRVDISKLNPDEVSGDDLTGGYIIKADKINYDLDEFFQIIPSVHYKNSDNYRFVYVYPEYDEIVPAQKSYIKKFLTDAENALNGDSFSDPVKGFRKFFDVNSFVNFQVIRELVNNVDGYRFSTFFYKDKDSKGGRLHAGPPWDFDLCYGNEDYTDFNLVTDIWLYPKFSDMFGGRMHWWARMMDDLGYRSVFVSRWKELRKGPFSTDSVMAYIDDSIEYLGDAIDHNFAIWPIIGKYIWPNYFIGETYEEEIDYLKGWISARLNWIDANIMIAENVSANYSKDEIIVFPNPAKNSINLYFYLSSSEKLDIEIYDLFGKKVLHDVITPADNGYQYNGIDISRLASGFYIIQVLQGKTRIGRENIVVSGR